ncbi:hypothetical protein C8J57DRAFT_1082995 [Mycena rebaudengoi]|nr:hypothetical protein C8J57DRAFT_1082995 [Mycena rebaudengoi]
MLLKKCGPLRAVEHAKHVNKCMIETENIKTTVIIPGRAMVLEMKNVDGDPLSILGVYAPNAPGENAAFWKTIKDWLISHPNVRKPNIMGGDMNIVEDGLDRLPAHTGDDVAVIALGELKSYLRLIDVWRETYPTTCAYTFHQSLTQGGAQSRIDRICVRRDLFEDTFEWDIQTVGIETDHRMVSTRLTTEGAPTLGHGRWVWPTHIIRDQVLAKYIHEKGLELEKELDCISNRPGRSENYNVQTVWARFKAEIGKKARERAKIVVPKIIQDIAEQENKLDAILADKTLSEEDRKLSSATVVEKLVQLQKQRYRTSRMMAQIRNRLEGEIIGRYWSMINKPKKPREIVSRLRKNTGPEGHVQYETNSQKMADMARSYHNKIQSERTDTPADVREEKIETVLGRTARKATPEQKEELRKKLTIEDVINALKMSANLKAPGLDGIACEVWKTLHARYETAKSLNKLAFNILRVLHKVYNDIETHGMVKGTGFSQSWMCPLYKKNDRAGIANYRPISLLNTDYKIFTKALTIKLGPDGTGSHPPKSGRVRAWPPNPRPSLADKKNHRTCRSDGTQRCYCPIRPRESIR